MLIKIAEVTYPPALSTGRLGDQLNYKPIIQIITIPVDSPSWVGGANGQIQITVSDNGNGIPEEVKERIFQPFFTTKPTGEGTGLGLSLSYDIVTKGHGGTLEVESEEGKGTEFIVRLPVASDY